MTAIQSEISLEQGDSGLGCFGAIDGAGPSETHDAEQEQDQWCFLVDLFFILALSFI